MNTLIIKDISKKHKKREVLSPLSFQANSGECIALCGGNGAGKSTLLKLLAGLSKPNSGTITLNDYTVTKNRTQYVEQISYMPDDFHISDVLTVYEFLSFYASLRDLGKTEVENTLEQVGLIERKREKVKTLSKGMKQRLLFAQALLGKPKLLLLDEPTNGLDPFWINTFIEIILELKEKGSIVIFSTHMMDVAGELADRTFFLQSGKVKQEVNEGTKDQKILSLLNLHRQK